MCIAQLNIDADQTGSRKNLCPSFETPAAKGRWLMVVIVEHTIKKRLMQSPANT